jgi:PKD repeat protein
MLHVRLLILGICVSLQGYSQLPNGAPAPDFTVEDINGNTYSLYAMMGSNKSACLDFSATWCGPCWSFHQSKILENVHNNLGAQTTVIMLEADWNTNTNCLYGPSGCNNATHGNWVAGTPYPIADLSSTNGPSVKSEYNIGYYPTLYVISPDKRVWEIKERSYQNYVNWITKSFALSATATLTHSLCGDNGKIAMNVTGGFSTIYYKWSNGATTKDLNNIPGGTYSVTISDVNNYFKVYGPYVIDGPSRRVDIVSSDLTHIKCFNEFTGNIATQTDYGTPPYTYIWSNGKTSSYNSNIKAGTYALTVSDSKGCTSVKSYTLTQPTALKLTASSGKDNCNAQDGFIQVKATGGVPIYNYDIGAGNQLSPYFSKLIGGKDYAVTVTDNNDCKEIITTYVDVTVKPKASAGQDKSIDCINPTTILDGSLSDKGSSYNNLWTTADGKIIKGEESLLPEVSKPGKYYLKITDLSNKCFDIDSVLVSDKSVYPDLSASNDTSLNCKFTESTLTGKSKHLPVRYFWTKLYDTAFYKNSQSITVSDSGKYVFHVKDTINLCISKDTIVISKNQIKPIAIASAEKNISCTHSEVLIDGSASSQGQDYVYQWTTLDGNIISGSNSLIPLVNKAGMYTLNVFNQINHCESNADALVLEQTLPEADFEQSIDLLTAQFKDLSNGIPDSWHWSFGDGEFSKLQHPKHTFPADGEYQICLTSTNDCGQDLFCQKILVGISASLTLVSSEVHNVSCYGGSDGFIKLTISGGVPPYSYNWSNQKTTKDLIDIAAGNYSIEIYDQQGTKLSYAFTIKEPKEITVQNAEIHNASSGKTDEAFCLKLKEAFSHILICGQTDLQIIRQSISSLANICVN